MLPGMIMSGLRLAAPLLLLAIFAGPLAACGDDNSDAKQGEAPSSFAGTVTTSLGPPLDDQDYAKTVCTSFNKYLASAVSKYFEDPSLVSDPKKLATVASPLLTTFADDMARVSPPDGIGSYHVGVLASIRSTVERLNNGQVRGLEDLVDLGRRVQPEVGIQTRLTAAARAVPECTQVPFFGASGFGG